VKVLHGFALHNLSQRFAPNQIRFLSHCHGRFSANKGDLSKFWVTRVGRFKINPLLTAYVQRSGSESVL